MTETTLLVSLTIEMCAFSLILHFSKKIFHARKTDAPFHRYSSAAQTLAGVDSLNYYL